MQACAGGVSLRQQNFPLAEVFAWFREEAEVAGLLHARHKALASFVVNGLEAAQLTVNAVYRYMQHPGPVLVKADGRHALGLEIGMIITGLDTRVPGLFAQSGGFFLGLLALLRPFKLLLRDFRPLGFHFFLAETVARGQPFDLFTCAEILYPAGGPLIQEAAVRAVQFATLAVNERNTMDRAVHDRSVAAQIQPGGFQCPGEFFLRRDMNRFFRSFGRVGYSFELFQFAPTFFDQLLL